MMRAARNQDLPRGIRIVSGRYRACAMKEIPGQFRTRQDGSTGPALKRVQLGSYASLADAVRVREDYLKANGLFNVD